MKIDTIEHFKILKKIFKKEGLLEMINYDKDITLARNSLLNKVGANISQYRGSTIYNPNLIKKYSSSGCLSKLKLNPIYPKDFSLELEWDYCLQITE